VYRASYWKHYQGERSLRRNTHVAQGDEVTGSHRHNKSILYSAVRLLEHVECLILVSTRDQHAPEPEPEDSPNSGSGFCVLKFPYFFGPSTIMQMSRQSMAVHMRFFPSA
jgi:hypothetical protein